MRTTRGPHVAVRALPAGTEARASRPRPTGTLPWMLLLTGCAETDADSLAPPFDAPVEAVGGDTAEAQRELDVYADTGVLAFGIELSEDAIATCDFNLDCSCYELQESGANFDPGGLRRASAAAASGELAPLDRRSSPMFLVLVRAANSAVLPVDTTGAPGSYASISEAVAADGVDNDCDGSVDPASAEGTEAWYGDADGDGYEDVTTEYFADADGAAATYPGAEDTCGDSVDQDCDGADAA